MVLSQTVCKQRNRHDININLLKRAKVKRVKYNNANRKPYTTSHFKIIILTLSFARQI